MDRIALDPVCGMKVDKKNPRGKVEYREETYYFCSPGCEKSFEKDPETYLDPDYKPSMPGM